MSLTQLPKLIRVQREHGRHFTIEIDGEKMSWPTKIGSVRATVARDEMPSIALELMAERVEIVDDVTQGRET